MELVLSVPCAVTFLAQKNLGDLQDIIVVSLGLPGGSYLVLGVAWRLSGSPLGALREICARCNDVNRT